MFKNGSFSWRPGRQNGKPPGNPFQRKEKKELPAPDDDDMATILPPHESRANTKAYTRPTAQQLRRQAEPVPDDVRVMVATLAEKFSMDKRRRDERTGRMSRMQNGKTLTHLEMLELQDPADERWFARNKDFVRTIVESRGSL